MKISVMSQEIWFMKAWNVAGALVEPIGMTRNQRSHNVFRKLSSTRGPHDANIVVASMRSSLCRPSRC